MQVRILGPVEGLGPDGLVSIDSPRERAVLSVLALRAGAVVTPSALVDAVWGADAPQSAAKSLQSHISRLRGRLAEGLIATEGSNYRLAVEPDEVDAVRFEQLIAAGRDAHEGGDYRRAVRWLDQAVDLWRGPPLTDLADGAVRDGEAARLEELRAAAVETRIDADLALAHHDRLIPEIEAFVAEHPLRERPWGQLMIALHRSGRSADALSAFRRLRAALGEELGIEPSAGLRRLEVQILQEDPALDAPAPRPPAHLPAPVTRFIGRGRQLAEVDKLLHAHRLVTLTGPGGVGKSRLAIEVASRAVDEWPDGVWWVDLARVEEVDVAPRIARVLDLTVPPGMALPEALHRFVASRRLLLVVDNAEQLASEVGHELSALLESGPEARVLATSRTPLGIGGERRHVVPPFELPSADGTPAFDVESMLFLADRMAEHGTAVPGAADVGALAELCRLSDGLPMALELIAGRIGVRTPAELARELRDRTVLLHTERPSADARQASLEAVLDAAVDALDSGEVQALGSLSVLLGSFAAESALAVSGDEDAAALQALVEAGLVLEVEPGVVEGERRYRMLDTTRVFAAERSEPELLAAARQRHAEYFRYVAVELGPAMDTPHEHAAIERIRQDDADVRAALGWWLEFEPTGALAFARAVGRAWYVWGDLVATLDMLDEALAGASSAAPGADVGWALLRRSWPRFLSGDVAGGEQDATGAVDLLSGVDDPVGSTFALMARGHMTLLATADTDAASGWYRRAIAEGRRSGHPHAAAWGLAEAAQALILADRVDEEVDDMLAEAEESFVAAGDEIGLAHVCMDRVLAAYARDDFDEVERAVEEGMDHARVGGDALVYAQIMTAARGVCWLHAGEPNRAEPLLADAARMAWDTQNLLQLGIALQAIAVLSALRDDAVAAARLWGAAGALAPFWPLFQRRYHELLQPVIAELGDRFDHEVEIGAGLALDEVMGLVRSQGAALAAI